MWWPTTWLIGLLLAGASAKMADYSVEICAAGASLKDYNNDVDTALTYIFPGMEIDCEGRLSNWEVYAKTKGKIVLSVWRPQKDKDSIMLVGRNELDIAKPGYADFEIPLSERIMVRGGDVIGVGFDAGTSPDDHVLTWGSAETDCVTVDRTNDQWSRGDTILESETSAPLKRVIPVRATIKGVTTFLRLADGDALNEGRAELKEDEVWGTYCDKWYKPRGWPFVFCLQMGYPDVEDAIYTPDYKDGSKVVGNDVPIHRMSPRCKPSQNSSMFSCDLHPNGECDHTQDLYVICKLRIAFQGEDKEPGKKEGVATVYQDGYWGTICDVQDPSTQDETGWPDAFCKGRGFAGMKEVHYAKDYMDNYTPSLPVAEMNPGCDVNHPTRLEECPPRATDDLCDNEQDYYIICK